MSLATSDGLRPQDRFEYVREVAARQLVETRVEQAGNRQFTARVEGGSLAASPLPVRFAPVRGLFAA